MLWMGVIFCFSAQNAEQSTNSSTTVTQLILGLMADIGIFSRTDFTLQFITRFEDLLRTAAHFTEYLILGVIACLFFQQLPVKKAWLKGVVSFAICMFYALADEYHQYYVPGRAMQFEDWLVDAFGSLVGILLIVFLVYRKNLKLRKHRNAKRTCIRP